MTEELERKRVIPDTSPKPEGLEALLSFVKERHNVYLRRAAGLPRPEWTEDPVLRVGHFCNIYRELDRVSVWVRENWRDPHKEDTSVVYAMFVARLINCTETLESIGYPDPNDVPGLKSKLLKLKSERPAIFSSAYLVVGSIGGISKIDWLCDHLFPLLARELPGLIPKSGECLSDLHARYMQLKDIGSFLAAQVLADLKYTELLPMSDGKLSPRTPDWSTWCAFGPGSRRGRNRVAGLPAKSATSVKTFLEEVNLIQAYLNSNIPPDWPRLHAQDTQNCLCEFDKYCRYRDSGKMPRRRYKGIYTKDPIQGKFL